RTGPLRALAGGGTGSRRSPPRGPSPEAPRPRDGAGPEAGGPLRRRGPYRARSRAGTERRERGRRAPRRRGGEGPRRESSRKEEPDEDEGRTAGRRGFEPRQGVVPPGRHHQGGSGRVLPTGGPGDAPPPQGALHLDAALPRRHRRALVLPEGR